MGGIAMQGRPLPLEEAKELGCAVIAAFKKKDAVVRAELAGSARRGKLTCGDVDIVAIPTPEFHEAFLKLFKERKYEGPVKYTGLYNGAQVDFLLTNEESWGAALMHATGPVSMNIKQRAKAKLFGMSLNEKGLWDGKDKVAGKTEESVYLMLDMKYVAPEAR